MYHSWRWFLCVFYFLPCVFYQKSETFNLIVELFYMLSLVKMHAHIPETYSSNNLMLQLRRKSGVPNIFI